MPTEVYPVTADRWPDLEALFGPKGGYGGCWCMARRVKRTEFSQLGSEGRKAELQRLTRRDHAPGVLAYQDGAPVGWCSIGPREEFAALKVPRSLKQVDGQTVWSIVCFFVAQTARRSGLMAALLRGAVAYARQQGARIIEGFPVDMQAPSIAGKSLTGYSGFTGIASVFHEAGFVEVGRVSETQLIMRLTVD
jgi:GNAT superfamily N-acetyltransferase